MASYFKGWALRMAGQLRVIFENTVIWTEGLGERRKHILPETRVHRLLGGYWHLPSVLDTSATCLKEAQVHIPPQYKLILRIYGSESQPLR